MTSTVVLIYVEFAGMNFKIHAISGLQYLKGVENGDIRKILHKLPKLKWMIICEEKYFYTPDISKAATHLQHKSAKKLV